MGRLWSFGKSHLVKAIRNASTKDAVMKLMPDNIESVDDWMDFVDEKTSAYFMLKSEKYKAMKKKQLPHTCSKKGYARLAEEMKKSFSDPTSITRIKLWTTAHKKKDGQLVNAEVAETIELIEQIEAETITSPNSIADDALSKVLGPDRGYVRTFGFGVTRSKLSILSQKYQKYIAVENKYLKMQNDMMEMKSMMSSFVMNESVPSEGVSNTSVPTSSQSTLTTSPSEY
ncbi:uncharacterized protein LOC111023579 isoform X3 [Momordica charantia]|uniref:Uncharacterized protein LOC111023579 isoform X3 n=1 Tax=Momordica charantia TaxID=3673 RepID=A0A6J1DR68_MOMCH|nr:uncharacterized protein LOC111023579 isoform X3 [Momordica charantia]